MMNEIKSKIDTVFDIEDMVRSAEYYFCDFFLFRFFRSHPGDLLRLSERYARSLTLSLALVLGGFSPRTRQGVALRNFHPLRAPGRVLT
jgi:hypothetical protein